MKLHAIDLAIVAAYLALVVGIGFWIKKRATRGLDTYYLAGRGMPWWMLGLAGCSSYIDIGGTMSMIGLLFYLGLKGLWATHLFWGWFIICFYMAFQAKWIRRSGVMTFAEWNETRFGKGGDVEAARIASAVFLLVLMICNLTFISVGTGKFGAVLLGIERWQAELIIFSVVGIYVTMGGFFGVIYTDMLQTVLIFLGAIVFLVLALSTGGSSDLVAARPGEWSRLAPTWDLWSGFLQDTRDSYQHFYSLGPLLLAGSFWCIFRILAGPNVWDFQFFLTARSPRDAAVAGGVWTVGYTARWIIACSILVLGFQYFGAEVGGDAEALMPRVLGKLSIGLRGIVVAILIAALMSTLDAMINVTSSVVVNDFLKRYFARNLSERRLVRWGQLASVLALILGFAYSRVFQDVVKIWESMIHIVVTMVLVPATFRWHWWRFSALAFVWGMAGSAIFIISRMVLLGDSFGNATLAVDTGGCLFFTIVAALNTNPPDMDVLVKFYSRVRPFGFWGPVRREAERRGLVPSRDPLPSIDFLNGILTVVFQFSLAAMPFYALLGLWKGASLWAALALALAVLLYFTWYRNLPPREEKKKSAPDMLQ